MVFINPGEKPVLRMHFYRRRAYSVYLWPCPISRGTTHCLSPSDKTQGPEMAITREQTQMPKSLMRRSMPSGKSGAGSITATRARGLIGRRTKPLYERSPLIFPPAPPSAPLAFAFGLPNMQIKPSSISACTSAASSCSAQSSRPGASTCKIASACKPH